MKLFACPSCERHIRSDETACPFCSQAVAFTCAAPCAEAPPGLSRAAVLFLGATALAGCGKESGGGEVVAVYGPAPVTTEVKQAIDAGPVLMIEPPNVQDAGVTSARPDAAAPKK